MSKKAQYYKLLNDFRRIQDADQIAWIIRSTFEEKIQTVLGSDESDFRKLLDEALSQEVIPPNVHDVLVLIGELSDLEDISRRSEDISQHRFVGIGANATWIDKLAIIGECLGNTMIDDDDLLVPQKFNVRSYHSRPSPQSS